jgi:hypothetical protein
VGHELKGFRAKITHRFRAVETKRIAAIGHFTVDSVRQREDEGRRGKVEEVNLCIVYLRKSPQFPDRERIE